MNIMKLNRLFALVAVAVMTVGCYEKFETVAPRPVYTDESFEAMFPEAEQITILELKEAFGEISNTGVNSGWCRWCQPPWGCFPAAGSGSRQRPRGS